METKENKREVQATQEVQSLNIGSSRKKEKTEKQGGNYQRNNSRKFPGTKGQGFPK